MRTGLLLALLLAHSIACEPPLPKDATTSQHVQSYSTEGTIESIAPNGRVLHINHEEIPGYMLSMTMPFEAQDPTMLKSLKVGDRVLFEFEAREDGRRVITKLKKK